MSLEPNDAREAPVDRPAPQRVDVRARERRVAWLLGVGLVVEALLYGVAKLSPALATLIRPVYAGVAIVTVAALIHASRGRERGHDRRHGDRRSHDG